MSTKRTTAIKLLHSVQFWVSLCAIVFKPIKHGFLFMSLIWNIYSHKNSSSVAVRKLCFSVGIVISVLRHLLSTFSQPNRNKKVFEKILWAYCENFARNWHKWGFNNNDSFWWNVTCRFSAFVWILRYRWFGILSFLSNLGHSKTQMFNCSRIYIIQSCVCLFSGQHSTIMNFFILVTKSIHHRLLADDFCRACMIT